MNSYFKYTDQTRIESIRASHEREMRHIDRNASRLTDEGKRIEKGRVYLEHRRQMNVLREQFQADVKAAKSRIESSLYGAGSTDPAAIVAHRDAVDRASQLKTDKAAKSAWEVAQLSGDVGLQKAIAAKASRHGFSDTLSAHIAEHPNTAPLFQELRSIPEVGGAGEVALFRVPKPSGFGLSDDAGIERTVANADSE
ncbi:MAG: hypothetical protein EOP24_37490 [Hyphomicrobiales bacterium]|nr:MAG: hypothetical protein EOP24_37490 [Hyphomicrobiales bacterium]